MASKKLFAITLGVLLTGVINFNAQAKEAPGSAGNATSFDCTYDNGLYPATMGTSDHDRAVDMYANYLSRWEGLSDINRSKIHCL